MNMVLSGMARFGLLTLAMLAHLALLAALEGTVLWSLGIVPFDDTSRVIVSAAEFSLSHDGCWGASVVRLSKSASGEGFRRDILVHDLRDSSRFMRLDVGDFDPRQAAISPAGDAVAFLATGSRVYIWRRGGSLLALRRLAPLDRTPLQDLKWSHDGRQISVCGEEYVYVWDAMSGSFQEAFELEAGAAPWPTSGAPAPFHRTACPLHFAASRQFARAAVTTVDANTRIDLIHLDSGESLGSLAHNAPLNGVAFANDGTLYSWDQQGVILGWNPGSQRPVWRFSCEEQAPFGQEGDREILAEWCKISSGRL
jgi:hypothetical protein